MLDNNDPDAPNGGRDSRKMLRGAIFLAQPVDTGKIPYQKGC